MKQKIKDLLIIVCGWIFIVLGIAGLFLPIVQGILFLLIGLLLLSKRSMLAKRILNMVRRRYPKLMVTVHEAEKKALRIWKKFGIKGH